MDCMIDMETLGVGNRPVVLSIGAVAFDKNGKLPEVVDWSQTFHLYLSLDGQQDRGLEISPSTVIWWMRQGDEARAQFDKERIPVHMALADFSNWFKKLGLKDIWSFGATADIVWLESLYKAFGMTDSIPYSYRNVRCFRTLTNVTGVPPPERIGVKHNALDDAIHQARWAQSILNP